MTAKRPSRSRLLVGSSRMRKSGSSTMRAARPQRVRCPPDSVTRGVSGATSSSTRSSAEAIRCSSVQSAEASSSFVASPASARFSMASASLAPKRSATVSSASTCTLWRRIPNLPLKEIVPDCGCSSPETSLISVVLPTPLRPTRPVRSAPKLRSRLERSGRPSGVDHERLDRTMDMGMNKNFPDDKAERRCGRGEFHCCTHPVGIADVRKLGDKQLQFKPGAQSPGQVQPLASMASRKSITRFQVRSAALAS